MLVFSLEEGGGTVPLGASDALPEPEPFAPGVGVLAFLGVDPIAPLCSSALNPLPLRD